MPFEQSLIRVKVYIARKSIDELVYESSFENHICTGELMRNCCVNIGIDPDTVEGITRNIKVFSKSGSGWKLWSYNPSMPLAKATRHDILEMKFEMLGSTAHG